MEDPNVVVGAVPDVEVVDSPSSSTDDLKDEKVKKVAGIDDDEEEFDLVSY
jgi:predicted transcriptional regulator